MTTTTQPRTPLQVIDRMIELLGEGEWRWTKGADARTANGDRCYFNHPQAVSCCLSGLLWRTTTDCDSRDTVRKVLSYLCKEKGFVSYVYFNDAPSTTYADVMALLRRAREIIVEETP